MDRSPIDIRAEPVKAVRTMKKMIIASVSLIALATMVALQSAPTNAPSTLACGGGTNSISTTFACGGCSNSVSFQIACGGCTNSVGSTLACGGCTNSTGITLALAGY